MNKDILLAALDAMQSSGDAGAYHDEIETLIALVTGANDSDIATAWGSLQTNAEETE